MDDNQARLKTEALLEKIRLLLGLDLYATVEQALHGKSDKELQQVIDVARAREIHVPQVIEGGNLLLEQAARSLMSEIDRRVDFEAGCRDMMRATYIKVIRDHLSKEQFDRIEKKLRYRTVDDLVRISSAIVDVGRKHNSGAPTELLQDDIQLLQDAGFFPGKRVTNVTLHNATSRPRRNGKCPRHPKVKFKNCPCSKVPVAVRQEVHEKFIEG